MSQTTSTMLFCCMDCISDRGQGYTIHNRALVYKHRLGTRHGATLSESKTETDFQNIAHSLTASPSSPYIAEQGQRSHLPCKQMLVSMLTDVAPCEGQDCQSPAIHQRDTCGPG